MRLETVKKLARAKLCADLSAIYGYFSARRRKNETHSHLLLRRISFKAYRLGTTLSSFHRASLALLRPKAVGACCNVM